MKNLIVLLALACLTSCSICPPASQITNGRAAQKHDRRPFRVIKIRPLGNGQYYVEAIRYFDRRKLLFECRPEIKDDSIWLD